MTYSDSRCEAPPAHQALLPMPVLLLCLLLCLLAVLPVKAVASVMPSPGEAVIDLAGRFEVLVDDSGALGIEDVRSPAHASAFVPAQPDSGDVSFGYSTSTYWLRLQLQAPAEQTGTARWLLELPYPALDRVEFYADGDTRPLIAGDRQPFAERPVAHRHPVFPLALEPGQTLTLYLRVDSEGAVSLPLKLWSPEAFETHNQLSYSLLSLYYGALLALMLYNLLLFLAIRNSLYLYYVLMLASMLLGQMAFNGIAHQFLWPQATHWNHVSLLVGFSLCGVFSALFTRSFLRTFNHARWLDYLLLLFALTFASLAVASLSGPYALVSMLLTAAGMLFALLAVGCGLYCLSRKIAGAGIYLIAWSFFLVGTAVFAARFHNLLPSNAFTAYAMQIGSALEMVLLSFGLANIINTLRRERALAQNEALEAQNRLIESLRQSEQNLALRVAQRTHELEQANLQLRANQQRLQHIAHHDPLTGLANRLLLEERIEHGIMRAMRHNSRIAVLLIDLDQFKPVNDKHGHAVGDELLVAVGKRFRGAVRAEDTVSRLGGDEFVIVLEDVFDISDVNRIVQTVENDLLRPFKVSEHLIEIGASVGYAFFPEDGKDTACLLHNADQMMYQIKERRGLRTAQQAANEQTT